jgi:hypothetical protein
VHNYFSPRKRDERSVTQALVLKMMKEQIKKHSIAIAFLLPVMGIGFGHVLQQPFSPLMHLKPPVIFFGIWSAFTVTAGIIAVSARKRHSVARLMVITWCLVNLLAIAIIIPSTVVVDSTAQERLKKLCEQNENQQQNP